MKNENKSQQWKKWKRHGLPPGFHLPPIGHNWGKKKDPKTQGLHSNTSNHRIDPLMALFGNQIAESNSNELNLPPFSLVQKKLCEKSFSHYVRGAWKIIEPGTELIWNWHLDAIGDHLTAVTDGQIRFLLINIPPREMKSILVSVIWPTWEWGPRNLPHYRYVCSSYDIGLAIRDALKSRRIMASDWYKGLWGDRFKITSDQNQKQRYENDRTGFRIATSVKGVGTGEGGDRIVCFPYEEKILTEYGPIAIGHIVSKKLTCKVWSYNIVLKKLELKDICGWYKNPSSKTVKIVFDNDFSFRCTPDHKILTTNGYVRADHLTSSDILPSFSGFDIPDCRFINGKNLRQTSIRTVTFSYFLDLLYRKFTYFLSVAFFPFSFGNISPSTAFSDMSDISGGNVVFCGDDFRGFIRSDNINDFFSVQNGPGSIFIQRKSPVSFGIFNILFPASIRKVCKAIIHRIAVKVSRIKALWSWSDKNKKHGLVNPKVSYFAFFTGPKSLIPVFIRRAFKHFSRCFHLMPATNHDCRQSSNSSLVGNLVQSFKSRQISPTFIDDGGHIDSSFCISVKDNHNFILGERQYVIVSNCDDPHNVTKAESDTERHATHTWWDESMSTRINQELAGAYVMICQRTHADDLPGHWMEKLEAEGIDLVRLILPARFEKERDLKLQTRTPLAFKDPRTKEGEPLNEGRFPDEALKQRRGKMTQYSWDSQMQQRPHARGGNLFDISKMVVIDHVPGRIKKIVRYWDKAATEDITAPRTAGVKMARLMDDRYIVLDVRKGQWVAGKRNRIIKQTAELDGLETIIWVEQEPGSGGKESAEISTKELAGFKVHTERVSGQKEDRAEAYASAIENDLVMILKASWTQEFIDEHETAPTGMFKDQWDAAAGAFNKLAGGAKKVGVW